MNKAISLLVLIHSMTKAEKRYFKLYSNLQEGDKVYLTLFALMEECSSVEEVTRRFGVDAHARGPAVFLHFQRARLVEIR